MVRATWRSFGRGDAKTYAVHTISFTGSLQQPKVNDRSFFKGWLAEVDGETFLTLQPVETLALLPGEKRDTVYLIAKLKLQADRLTATGLDPNYDRFKGLKSSAELERLITQNSQDPKMWTKPIEARRLGQRIWRRWKTCEKPLRSDRRRGLPSRT